MELVEFDYKYIDFIHKWNNDKELASKVGFDKEQSFEDTEVFLGKHIENGDKILLVIHHEEPIGYFILANLNVVFKSCALHTFIGDRRYHNSPVCIKAVDEILYYAFNKLEMHRVETYAIDNNEKLVNVILKYGFVKEGVLREALVLNNKRYNYIIFSMLKSEFKRRASCQ